MFWVGYILHPSPNPTLRWLLRSLTARCLQNTTGTRPHSEGQTANGVQSLGRGAEPDLAQQGSTRAQPPPARHAPHKSYCWSSSGFNTFHQHHSLKKPNKTQALTKQNTTAFWNKNTTEFLGCDNKYNKGILQSCKFVSSHMWYKPKNDRIWRWDISKKLKYNRLADCVLAHHRFISKDKGQMGKNFKTQRLSKASGHRLSPRSAGRAGGRGGRGARC